MTIGETLAKARRSAGLTVTQVSERTRVRETIIRGIEQDDYTACGGDFYARGHIRSIARVVGADPVPLIAEYDATLRAPEEITAAQALEPTMPIRPELIFACVSWMPISGLRTPSAPSMQAIPSRTGTTDCTDFHINPP